MNARQVYYETHRHDKTRGTSTNNDMFITWGSLPMRLTKKKGPSSVFAPYVRNSRLQTPQDSEGLKDVAALCNSQRVHAPYN